MTSDLDTKNGEYHGSVLKIFDGLLEQNLGGRSVKHDVARLSFVPKIGSFIKVKYKDGFATVKYDPPPDNSGGHELELKPGKKKKKQER